MRNNKNVETAHKSQLKSRKLKKEKNNALKIKKLKFCEIKFKICLNLLNLLC